VKRGRRSKVLKEAPESPKKERNRVKEAPGSPKEERNSVKRGSREP